MVTRRHIRLALAATVITGSAIPAAAASAAPVANELPANQLPASSGAAWTANPIASTAAPQNPYMAANGKSNLHNDTWMTDAYASAGPLGRNLVASSSDLGASVTPGVCASMAFDSRGRIVTICPAFGLPTLRLIDPTTLTSITSLKLPKKTVTGTGNQFQDFTGGGYFFLDNRDRAVIPTNDRRILVIGQDRARRKFTQVTSYSLASKVAKGEGISSALPDFQGRIWFVTKAKGKVGFVNTRTRAVTSVTLNEEIENSFAVGSDGVYIVSDKALYRFNAVNGRVRQDWRTVYDNSGIRKPGQVDAGSGTTPTIMAGGLVAITDNADPMNVVVYRTDTGAKTCSVPVFAKGASATENSLIGADGMLIVENNYGYEGPSSVADGNVTAPGITRVNVSPDGTSCSVAWANTGERVPSVVSKLSLATGLVYTYTKPETTGPSDTSTPWFWTAIDARTGNRVWRKLAGTGSLKFNNNYTGIHIGPDGALYMGAIGGILKLADGP